MSALTAAYRERNLCVVAIARMMRWQGYGVGVRYDSPDGPEWPVLYVDGPAGQMSWHLPADELPPDLDVPYHETWDGHSTEEKYARLLRASPVQVHVSGGAQHG